MHFSTITATLALASSVLALPAEQLDKRVSLCLANNLCQQGDAKEIVDDMIGRGKAQERITVGTGWTSIAYYADCQLWAHSGSGTDTEMAGDVSLTLQVLFSQCKEGNAVGGAQQVGSNFYMVLSTNKPN